MAQNNTAKSPSGNPPNVDNTGLPRGPNLSDIGHTGPKTGDEALTTGEQHREMSQHEYRGGRDSDDHVAEDEEDGLSRFNC